MVGVLIVAFITFFLRRLVSQIDILTTSVTSLAKEVAVMKAEMQSLQHKTRFVELKDNNE